MQKKKSRENHPNWSDHGDQNLLNLKWKSPGEIISGQGTNSIEVTWSNDGIAVIYVTEIGANGCESSNSITISINDYTSLDENDNDYVIFPNPVTQNTSVFITNKNNETYNIIMMDIHGKITKSYSNINDSNFEIPCNNLSKGTYIAQLVSNTKSTRKLIVIK